MNEWNQLPNEEPVSYTRFLFFLSFGPTRNLPRVYNSFLRQKARKSKKKQAQGQRVEDIQVSNTWRKEHAMHEWDKRAASWDKVQLLTKGEQVVVDYIEILRLFARKILLTLMDDEIRPNDFDSVTDAIRLLSTFISAEAVAAVASGAGSGGTENGTHAANGHNREPIRQLPG